LRFEPLKHGGKCPDMLPTALQVYDRKGRSVTYLPVEQSERAEERPQDEWGVGMGLTFETRDSGNRSGLWAARSEYPQSS
jgi:hypothetical protein